MVTNAYGNLAEHLNTFPTSFPRTKEGTEIALLKKFFTEEEAEIAAKLPLMFGGQPKDAQIIADEMNKDVNEVQTTLDAMVNKGLAHVLSEGDFKGFALFAFVPGIMEFNTERTDREAAQLFEDYYEIFFTERSKSRVPLSKVVPINRSLTEEVNVRPYEDVAEAIRTSTSICLMPCMCRNQKKAIGKDCGRPIDTCLYLNEFAEHLLGLGKGRRLTKEEAMKVLTEAEDAGLVHISGNAQGLLGICSCCGCCCISLRGMTQLKNPRAFAKSDFEVALDSDRCIACGECVDRCWMDALSVVDDHAVINRDRCIGCGACVYTCPAEALTLERRPQAETKPLAQDMSELLAEMGWRMETEK